MADAKIYCGDKSNIPERGDYTRFGTRNECLKCGFGAAMYQYRWAPADRGTKPPPREREGCLRSRQRSKGVVRGNQFIRRGGGSTAMSPQINQNGGGNSYPPMDYTTGSSSKPRVEHKSIITQRVRRILAISTWSIACIITFVLMYTMPPSIVTKIENQKKVIQWGKFIGVYCGIVVAITSVVLAGYYALSKI